MTTPIPMGATILADTASRTPRHDRALVTRRDGRWNTFRAMPSLIAEEGLRSCSRSRGVRGSTRQRMGHQAGPRAGGRGPSGGPAARALWWAALATAGFALALGRRRRRGHARGRPASASGSRRALRAGWIGLYAGVGLYLAWRRPEWGLGVLMTTLGRHRGGRQPGRVRAPVPYTLSRIATLALVPVAALMLMTFPAGRVGKDREAARADRRPGLLAAIGAAYLMVPPTAPWSQAVSECRGACAELGRSRSTDSPGTARGRWWSRSRWSAIVSILAALVGPGARDPVREPGRRGGP